jgi:hypothetical protein
MEVSGYSSVIDLRTVRPHLGMRNERWYRDNLSKFPHSLLQFLFGRS